MLASCVFRSYYLLRVPLAFVSWPFKRRHAPPWQVLRQVEELGFSKEYCVQCLNDRKRNHITATYTLLLQRLQRHTVKATAELPSAPTDRSLEEGKVDSTTGLTQSPAGVKASADELHSGQSTGTRRPQTAQHAVGYATSPEVPETLAAETKLFLLSRPKAQQQVSFSTGPGYLCIHSNYVGTEPN